MMLVVSMPFQDNLVLVYIAGCIGATVLEYVTGVTMEALFKVRYCRRMYDLDMFFLFLLRMFHTAQPSVAQIDPFFLFTDDHVQSVLIVSGL